MSSDPIISGMHTIFVENNSIEHNDRTILFGAKFSCPSAQNVCKVWCVCLYQVLIRKCLVGETAVWKC